MDLNNDMNEHFLEPVSIWEIKDKDNSTQFNEKFAKLVKRESDKLNPTKTHKPSINIDIHKL